MKRSDEIEEAAKIQCISDMTGFIRGAKWADENPCDDNFRLDFVERRLLELEADLVTTNEMLRYTKAELKKALENNE